MKFDSMDIAWEHVVNECLNAKYAKKRDSRNGPSTELIGHSFTITDIGLNVLTNSKRKFSPAYASAELLWYLGRYSSIDMISHYAPQYKNFANEGHAHGAYGHRIASGYCGDQLDQIMEILKGTPLTRQAVLQLWSPRDLWHAINNPRRDLPCTLSIQFLLSDSSALSPSKHDLNMIVTMRSNDMWLGTPYDVYCFSSIQRLVADRLGFGYGTYTHNAGSMHIYQKNYEQCAAAICVGVSNPIEHGYHKRSNFGQLGDALRCEKSARLGEQTNSEAFLSYVTPNTLLRDSAALCYHEAFGGNSYVESPALRATLERFNE